MLYFQSDPGYFTHHNVGLHNNGCHSVLPRTFATGRT